MMPLYRKEPTLQSVLSLEGLLTRSTLLVLGNLDFSIPDKTDRACTDRTNILVNIEHFHSSCESRILVPARQRVPT